MLTLGQRGRRPRTGRAVRPGTWWLVAAALAVAVVATSVVVGAGPRQAVGPGSEVAVIGDSYSRGTVLGGLGSANWTAVLATARQWRLDDVAVGATGYVASLPPSGPYASAQLDQALADDPALVIVQGSINDGFFDPAFVGAAASTLYAEIHRRDPDARLVVVGPFVVGQPAGPSALRDAVARAARDAGAMFLDPLAEQWFAGTAGTLSADGVHPTDAGHAVFAGRVGAALREAGI